MRVKATAAILVLLPLLVLGLIACGTDSGAAANQIDQAAENVQSVAIVDEAHDDGYALDVAITDEHDDGDTHDVAITDEHDDGDTHDVAITDEHDDEDAHDVAITDEHDDGDIHDVAITDEHDDEDAHDVAITDERDDGDEHAEIVLDTHDGEAAESHAHANMDGPVDPDAPIMHVSAREFGYETATTEVTAGQPFSIQISNDGVLEHDITFAGLEDQFGLHVQPGENDIATFSIDEAGEYVYYCTIPGHREAGMTGTLMVSGVRVAADDDGNSEAAAGA